MEEEQEEENNEEDYTEPVEAQNDTPNVDDFDFNFGNGLDSGQEPMGIEMPILKMPINQLDLGLDF